MVALAPVRSNLELVWISREDVNDFVESERLVSYLGIGDMKDSLRGAVVLISTKDYPTFSEQASRIQPYVARVVNSSGHHHVQGRSVPFVMVSNVLNGIISNHSVSPDSIFSGDTSSISDDLWRQVEGELATQALALASIPSANDSSDGSILLKDIKCKEGLTRLTHLKVAFSGLQTLAHLKRHLDSLPPATAAASTTMRQTFETGLDALTNWLMSSPPFFTTAADQMQPYNAERASSMSFAWREQMAALLQAPMQGGNPNVAVPSATGSSTQTMRGGGADAFTPVSVQQGGSAVEYNRKSIGRKELPAKVKKEEVTDEEDSAEEDRRRRQRRRRREREREKERSRRHNKKRRHDRRRRRYSSSSSSHDSDSGDEDDSYEEDDDDDASEGSSSGGSFDEGYASSEDGNEVSRRRRQRRQRHKQSERDSKRRRQRRSSRSRHHRNVRHRRHRGSSSSSSDGYDSDSDVDSVSNDDSESDMCDLSSSKIDEGKDRRGSPPSQTRSHASSRKSN